MSFTDLLRSRKIFVCFIIMFIFSIFLQFLPLIGRLGYEYSVIISFLISFISVFTSAEIFNDYKKSTFIRSGIKNLLFSVFIINFLILLIAFAIGFLGSLFDNLCDIQNGLIFFVLIPFVSLIFTSSLGSLCGLVFGDRGFLVGSVLLILILIAGLHQLYSAPHIFIYNAVIGYFPGPIYDFVIPITKTLIVYRIYIFIIGIFIYKIIDIYFGSGPNSLNFQNLFLLVILLFFIIFCFFSKQRLGFTYSREYITTNFLTETLETDNFVFYYSPNSKFSANMKLVAEDHEWRFRQLKQFLEIKSDDKIHSYIYPDTGLRKKLIGAGKTTIADPIHKEIHLVYNSFPNNVLKHELVHVLSSEFGMKLLKISPKIGLIEGLAVAADWERKGIDRHQWSRTLIDSGMAPEIENILGYGFWYAPGTRAYTLMGSFCKYLIDTFGIEKFKEYYRSGDPDVYSMPLEQLVNEWKEYLYKITVPEKVRNLAVYVFSDQGIFGDYCVREVEYYKSEGTKAYNDNKFELAAKLFEKADKIDRNNPEISTLLAYSKYYNKDYKGIETITESVEGYSNTDVNILKNLYANSLWQRGSFYRALSIFKDLKNKSLPEDILREIDIKISLEEYDSGLKDLFRDFFSENELLEKINILNDINNNFPDYAPAYYLKGRLHFNSRDYERASINFFYADSLGLPTRKLQTENLILLGTTHYINKRYDLAIEIFEEILILDEKNNNHGYILDFIDRSRWASGKN